MENITQKLEVLAKLQAIDVEIDRLVEIRGALPDEVKDLEDEVIGFETRISNYGAVIQDVEGEIETQKNAIKTAEKLIKKYEEQQLSVRNNREYDAITKELEFQQLEIQACDKKIKKFYLDLEERKKELEETQAQHQEKRKDLEVKKRELNSITEESQEEEEKLNVKRENVLKKVDERLLKSYNKIRKSFHNGLAIVNVQRHACGGCFNIVPPQRIVEVEERKKIVVCEHCGRIFYQVEVEEQPKPTRTRRKTTKSTKSTKKK